LYWFAVNLFLALFLPDYKSVAYWGHIGGFLGGVVIILILIKLKLVIRNDWNPEVYKNLE
jgi:membrane associated rhomboid family serine protease